MRPLALALSVIKNRTGAVPRPSWCTYLVCYRCNARCQMCDSWRVRPGDEMTPPQVASVFKKIGRLDVVRLTGGEPFLRTDMLEIAEAVRAESRPFVIHITTNGSFPDRIVDFVRRFSRPRMLRFMVSFDGMSEEHDRNRGEEVTFAIALDAVRRLTELRDEFGLEVSANHTVISPKSLEDNVGLRRELGAIGVDVHSVIAYADSAMYGAKLRGTRAEHLIVPTGYPLHPALAGADVVGFVEDELRRVREFRDPLLRKGKRYYLRGLRDRLVRQAAANGNGHADTGVPVTLTAGDKPVPAGNGNGTHAPGPKRDRDLFQPPCVALRSHIRLLPDGSVPICQFNTEKVGNLLQQSFDEIWYGQEIRPHRAWVDACPGCWAECEVMPSALYTADILRG